MLFCGCLERGRSKAQEAGTLAKNMKQRKTHHIYLTIAEIFQKGSKSGKNVARSAFLGRKKENRLMRPPVALPCRSNTYHHDIARQDLTDVALPGIICFFQEDEDKYHQKCS
jgi:hypothetical protein